ncbi:MAG: NifB/NifX family molybdenum-iron cluster-binding protein [Candidatus Hydrogenedentes bacterium]|nr:NifB/NifX family molybdenum-iron cluster-binding protein [Candidatus Hydrogenedentota bacterium]
MKIAVTATGATLDAQVDPRFARCPFFLIVDTDSMDFEAIDNLNLSLGSGAGVQSGQLIAEKGVQFVLTGNCGPNAHQTLSAAGIDIIVGCSGVVRDVVEQFKAGELDTVGAANVSRNFGASNAPEPSANSQFAPQQAPMSGKGMGGGRGMGRGGGRGMKRGMGMGPGFQTPVPPVRQASRTPHLSEEEELAALKQQAEAIAQGLQSITERIEELERKKQGQ